MKSLFPTKATCLTTLFFTLSITMAQKDRASLLGEATQIQVFDTVHRSKIMVLGTYHFTQEVLSDTNQPHLEYLIELLSKFAPTKVVVEWEPGRTEEANAAYQKYLLQASFIENKPNEVYQLGFRLAKKMKHDSIYLFDDQTEFIGSLEGFTFEGFDAYAKENDVGFYDKYIPEITKKFQANQEIFKAQNPLYQIMLRNSPKAQNFNIQRMHSYEMRVGIQKSWVGPDWLGRFYRRNIRMAANVMKMNSPHDRILIIVGDNHKWILDNLFESIPDFELVSSWDHLVSKTN